MERRRTATATGLYDSFCHIYSFLHSFSLHLFVSQKNLNDEELYRQKYRKLLHFEINILNILNIFTEIIGMAPSICSINVQDWYGDRHTCQIASGALECELKITGQVVQKHRKLLHFEINILNILNIFTEIIGMVKSRALWKVKANQDQNLRNL